MLRIGDFSQIGRVTIDALRYYDEIGLLKPAEVDPSNSYRYYSAAQLKTLNRIHALKAMGFSLEEVSRVIHGEIDDEELRGMLKEQLRIVAKEVGEAEARKHQIMARLDHLAREDEMPEYEVTMRSDEEKTVASIRQTVPSADKMPEICGQMFEEIASWMQANGLPFGPSITIYHSESYRRENIDTECAFIVPDAKAASEAEVTGSIQVRILEAVPEIAVTIIDDDFYKKVDGLTPAYNAIGRWIEEHGYQVAGPARELFYGSPEAGDLTAEVQIPVARETAGRKD